MSSGRSRRGGTSSTAGRERRAIFPRVTSPVGSARHDGLALALRATLTRPTSLTPAIADEIGRALRPGSGREHTYTLALGTLAALLYARPDLVPESLLDRLAVLLKAGPVPAGVGRAVVKLFEYLASSPAAARAWTLLVEVLRDEKLEPRTRELLLPLLKDFVHWREDLVGLDGALALAGSPAFARDRAFLLDHVVERFVFTQPEAFTEERLTRVAALYQDAPRYRYFLYSLAARRSLRPAVRALVSRWLEDRFPSHEAAAAMLENQPFKILVAFNARMGQGDEIIRLAPLLQALLDANPDLTITLISRRAYLYDNARVEPVQIEDDDAVHSALGDRFDGVMEVFEPNVPKLAFRPELHAAIERLLAEQSPAFVVRGDMGYNHFLYQRVDLGGRDLARAYALDRLGFPNVYETCMRLIAELGLPQRAAEEPSLTPSLLAGERSADAERVWENLLERDTGEASRPVALLNAFGGGRPTKGFLEQHSQLLGREIAGLVEEGYRVVLLPNGAAWASRSAVARILSHLARDVRGHLRVAPDPAQPKEIARLRLSERSTLSQADRVMRLFKYFATYADLVVTNEGWLTHLAYSLGRPFRLFLAAQSYGFDWHPHGRGSRQQLVTMLSPRSRARYAESELLGPGQTPPLPHRPRKTLLELALDSLGRAGSAESVTLLRRALASPDHDVRAWAVAGLGRAPSLEVVKPDLLAALEDREPSVVREAADALLRGNVDCRDALGSRYRERIEAHAEVARQHWAAVARLGAAAFPALFRAAESDNDVIRREARWTLARTLRLHIPHLSSRPGQGGDGSSARKRAHSPREG
jgi:hypothetical protein